MEEDLNQINSDIDQETEDSDFGFVGD